MLYDTKRDLTWHARRLPKRYEDYTIDELASAYCYAVDTQDEDLKNKYISALILRFWYVIDRLYNDSNSPSLEREDFFWWLYEAIEYACKYRGWQDPTKSLNAQQCINKCIDTIKLQKYYNLRLDKRKAVNHCIGLDTPLGDESGKTIGDTFEVDCIDYNAGAEVMSLVQGYINRNKIIEAILIDNIAFNDVQKYTKKTIKTKNAAGEDYKYVEHSSEFWPFRLIQIVSKLPDTYKSYFLNRYNVSEDKLTAILDVINRANNQKLYRYLRCVLEELRTSYAY